MSELALKIRNQINEEDRFALAMLAAVVFHALVILGIGFSQWLEQGEQPLPPSMEVTLVNTRSEQAPEQYDYLAQANQEGGGNSEERTRPKTPFPASLPTNQPEITSRQPSQAAPPPTQEQMQASLLSGQRPDDLASEQRETPAQPVPTPSARELIARSLNIAGLEAEIDASLQAYARMPQRKFVTASTREYRFASYMETWRRKVEKVGNLNFPDEIRRRGLSGKLILEVAINANGTIHSIHVVRSSGKRVLDAAAIDIVRRAAPYAPLPDNIREDTDVLHITRTWKFLGGGRLSTR